MPLDYSSFVKAHPISKDWWIVLGVVHRPPSKPTFTFLDAMEKPRKSENMQIAFVFIDEALKYDYVIIVRQDIAHKRGWLQRYQVKMNPNG